MLKIFLITPLVELPQQKAVRRRDGTVDYVKGYYRTIGVAATNLAHAVSIVKADITEGEILKLRGGEAQPSSLEPGIREHYQPPERPGIWYRSGRAFYGPELQPP